MASSKRHTVENRGARRDARPQARRKRARRSGPLSLRARLRRVKLFLCDVDGVMTDGSISMSPDAEYKRFHVPDGLGLHLLQKAGIKVGWISNRPSPVTARRAAELKVDFLKQQGEVISKPAAVEGILAETGRSWDDVCYLGDDIVDLGVLRRAGLAVAVSNAGREVKAQADYVTKASGGRGAVREAVEIILKAQNKWNQMLKLYAGG